MLNPHVPLQTLRADVEPLLTEIALLYVFPRGVQVILQCLLTREGAAARLARRMFLPYVPLPSLRADGKPFLAEIALLDVFPRGVEVMLQRLLTDEDTVALLARRMFLPHVLLQILRANANPFLADLALLYVFPRGVEMMLQSVLADEDTVALLARRMFLPHVLLQILRANAKPFLADLAPLHVFPRGVEMMLQRLLADEDTVALLARRMFLPHVLLQILRANAKPFLADLALLYVFPRGVEMMLQSVLADEDTVARLARRMLLPYMLLQISRADSESPVAELALFHVSR